MDGPMQNKISHLYLIHVLMGSLMSSSAHGICWDLSAKVASHVYHSFVKCFVDWIRLDVFNFDYVDVPLGQENILGFV